MQFEHTKHWIRLCLTKNSTYRKVYAQKVVSLSIRLPQAASTVGRYSLQSRNRATGLLRKCSHTALGIFCWRMVISPRNSLSVHWNIKHRFLKTDRYCLVRCCWNWELLSGTLWI